MLVLLSVVLIIICIAFQSIHFAGFDAGRGSKKEKYGFDKNMVINEEVRYGYFIKAEFYFSRFNGCKQYALNFEFFNTVILKIRNLQL